MKAIVANSLREGDVVYWNAGGWASRFREAEIFTDDAAVEAALAVANNPLAVVDCYPIDVADEGEGPVPVAFRERIKALGPQNHPLREGSQVHVAPDRVRFRDPPGAPERQDQRRALAGGIGMGLRRGIAHSTRLSAAGGLFARVFCGQERPPPANLMTYALSHRPFRP